MQTIERLKRGGLIALLFLLPWQTRFIFGHIPLAGGFSEYGVLSLFAIQIGIISLWVLHGTRTFPAWPWILIGISVVASLCGGMQDIFPVSLLFFASLWCAFLLFFLIRDSSLKTTTLLWAFILGLVPPCILGLAQVFFGENPSASLFGLAAHQATTLGTAVVDVGGERILRAYGSLPHPNVFGGYLAVGMLCVYRCFLEETQRYKRYCLLALACLFSVTIALTFSRGAWLAMDVGLALCIFLDRIPTWKSTTRDFLTASFSTVTLMMFFIPVAIIPSAFFHRLTASGRLEQISLNERTLGVSSALQLISHDPFVGSGPGLYPWALWHTDKWHEPWVYQPVHNVYLLIGAETGFIGGVGLFSLVIVWIIRILSERESIRKASSISLVVILVLLGLFDHYLWSLWAGQVLAAFTLGITQKTSVS